MIVVTAPNLDDVLAEIDATPRRIQQSTINAVNRTATFARQRIVDTEVAATGIKRKLLMDRHTLQRASTKKNRLFARIIPSSAGIPVPEYNWKFELAGSQVRVKASLSGESYGAPTYAHPGRARILVAWPGGYKIAAGFVNPLSQYRSPLTTRLYAYRGDTSMYIALAPSAAALFKIVMNSRIETEISVRLGAEFITEQRKLESQP